MEITHSNEGAEPEGGPAVQSGGTRQGIRVVSVATSKRLGSNYFARKLNEELGVVTFPSETPIDELVRQVQESHPSICHIQFEYRSFGGAIRTLLVLPRFVHAIARTTQVIVTIHGLLTRESVGGVRGRASLAVHRYLIRRVAKSTSQIVVLSNRMRSELASGYGIRDAIVIPLGSDPFPTGPTSRDPPYLLFFGFLRPSKGLSELVEAFGQVAGEFPELRLVIAGGPVKSHEIGFVAELEEQIRRHPFRDRIRLEKRFVSWTEKDDLARSASIVVLPYKDHFIEVSAVVHDVAGSGAPIICSDTPRFDELKEGVEAIHTSPQVEPIAAAIRAVLLDPHLAARLSAGARELARRDSWSEIARRHRELYASLTTTSLGAKRSPLRD